MNITRFLVLALALLPGITLAQEAPVPTTATKVCQAYKDNEVAADNAFKGKPLEVAGKVRRVYQSARPNAACVDLEDETDFAVIHLRCEFDPKAADLLVSLEAGQRVKVRGTGGGKDVFFVRVTGCTLADPAPAKLPKLEAAKDEPKDDKPLALMASELAGAYRKNEIAADRKYKGQVVEIAGTVNRVHKKRTAVCVDLDGGVEFSLLTVECQFDPKQADEVAKLTKGQAVTVRGKVGGKGLFERIEVKECVLGK